MPRERPEQRKRPREKLPRKQKRRTVATGYGGNKARSEKALLEMFGDRVGIARPSAIMGPGDESLSYHYWLSHLKKDQEIVAPGTGTDAFVQYIDVRDVASWMIDSVEGEWGISPDREREILAAWKLKTANSG